MTPLKHPQSGRVASRFPAGLPASVTWPAASFECEAADISRSGVLIAGDFPSPSGKRVDVTLMSPARDLRLSLHGRVARVVDGQPTRIGIEFHSLSNDDRQALESILSRVIEGTGSGPLAQLAPDARPDEVKAALAKMPLPHRIGLASRAQAQERRWLRLDASPLVLEALARNPGLALDEALALSRIPSLRPAAIASLAADTRWHTNDDLQILLAAHPQVALPIALQIVPRLNERARARLLERPGLNAAVRAKLLGPPGRRTR